MPRYSERTKQLKTPKKPHTKLTNKRKNFIDALITTGNAHQAYEIASPKCKDSSAKSQGISHMLNNQKTQIAIQERLDKSGLNVEYLNNRLRQLTTAEKAIVLSDTIVNVQDNPTSLEALKVAYKLHRLLDDKQQIVNIDQRTQTVELSHDTVIRMDKTVNELRALNVNLNLCKEMGGEIELPTENGESGMESGGGGGV